MFPSYTFTEFESWLEKEPARQFETGNPMNCPLTCFLREEKNASVLGVSLTEVYLLDETYPLTQEFRDFVRFFDQYHEKILKQKHVSSYMVLLSCFLLDKSKYDIFDFRSFLVWLKLLPDDKTFNTKKLLNCAVSQYLCERLKEPTLVLSHLANIGNRYFKLNDCFRFFVVTFDNLQQEVITKNDALKIAQSIFENSSLLNYYGGTLEPGSTIDSSRSGKAVACR